MFALRFRGGGVLFVVALKNAGVFNAATLLSRKSAGCQIEFESRHLIFRGSAGYQVRSRGGVTRPPAG
jgi:hypothetical protein